MTYLADEKPSRTNNHYIKIASIFYGIFILGALLWSHIAARRSPLYDPQSVIWERTLIGFVGGLLLGFVVVGSSRFLLARFSWARALHQWFASVLGPLSWMEVSVLAVLSSVGEEMFFRGAMQYSFGLWITAAVFGLAHVPPRLALWPWTLIAAVFGLVFGLMVRWSGDLAGAIAAHFVINLLNLRQISRFAATMADRAKSDKKEVEDEPICCRKEGPDQKDL